LDKNEIRALEFSLRDFDGDVYLFGSRLDEGKKGGDIDIMLIPKAKINNTKLSLRIQADFFYVCEQKIDIVVYDDNPFCKEILKYAKRIDIEGI
jgi:predicted nucleotidyltransferase